MANRSQNKRPLCSFCGRGEDEVMFLIPSPTGAFICDNCVAACSELIEEDIFALITPEACVNVRTVTGGPSEKSVENQILSLKNYCNEFSRK